MNETYRNIAVVIEIKNSIRYLRYGLAEIQKITAANDFYDPPLIYLSGGLERLFKSMLCLNFKEIKGRLPNTTEIWSNNHGHDIMFLKKEVEKICIPINRPFAEEDYKIITENKTINETCGVLSAYGNRARYFNLDAILGKEQEYDAKSEWESLEKSVLIEYYGEKMYYAMIKQPKFLDEIYRKVSELLVSKIELFLRAITRQFTFGNFYSGSKNFLFEVESFADLDDNQIGKTDYRGNQIETIKKR